LTSKDESCVICTDEKNFATLVCPKCSKAKRIDASPFLSQSKVFRVRCSCKQVFTVTIDFRKSLRKEVTLPGEFINPETEERGEMLVENFSMKGMRFSPLKPHKIVPGDVIEVSFTLEATRAIVRRTVLVKHVTGASIGTEFSLG
jgi:hypothetical protein